MNYPYCPMYFIALDMDFISYLAIFLHLNSEVANLMQHP